MKQLSKLMLVAVASIAIAAPAFAWDFSASGTASARLNSTNTKPNKDGKEVSSGGVTSDSSSLKLASSHTDGPKTLSLSYTLDWDGNLDETITLSGTSKVGDWTASGDVSYNRDRPGCIDNGTSTSATSNPNSACNAQTGEDSTSVTVTNGTMTIKLGDAGHLSSQNKSTNSAAAGALTWDAADDDASIGAFVDSFHGVSLGYKVSDAMSVTVAYQTSSEADDMCGAGEYQDGEGATHGTTSTGFGFDGTFGTISVGATMCNSSTEDKGDGSADPGKESTSMSTMGVGLTMDMGDIDPFLSYGTYKADGSQTKNGVEYSGSEVGLTYALGSDTVIIYVGNSEETATASGTAGDPVKRSGMEVGYNTMVGPASLSIGYGTQSITNSNTGATNDGYSMTDIEIAMGYSF